MKAFSEYDAFVEESGASDARHEEKLYYAALKLTGEAGEVAELVGKSMPASKKYAWRGALDPVALALELGDVLWYVARLAALHGYTLGEIATVNRDKLRRRAIAGKDPAGELEMAGRILETMARRILETAKTTLTASEERSRILNATSADDKLGHSVGGTCKGCRVKDAWLWFPPYCCVLCAKNSLAENDRAAAIAEREYIRVDQSRCGWCLDAGQTLDPDGYCSKYCRRESGGFSPTGEF